MKELFPENANEFNYPKLVIHKMYAQNNKRTEFDEIVIPNENYWSLDGFLKLI